MMIKKIEARYKTEDGREWETEVEAARHQALLDAERQLKEAITNFERRLFETQKTADGQMLKYGLFHDYYYIDHNYCGLPRIMGINFYGRDFHMTEYRDEYEIFYTPHGSDKRIRVRISEIYASRANARKALLKACEVRMANYHEEINKLRGNR